MIIPGLGSSACYRYLAKREEAKEKRQAEIEAVIRACEKQLEEGADRQFIYMD
jgi:hypothetical protein